MNWEHDYLNLLQEVAEDGEVQEGRNGTTRSKFGVMIESRELEDSYFPILTTRKMYPEGIFGELAAFVRGAEMLKDFKDFGCNYWDANAAAWGYNLGLPPEEHLVGKIYGYKWRNFHGVDQLERLVEGLKKEPRSRRHVLTTYDPSETFQCLPPCHLLAQYSVRRGGILESCVYMRSVDLCVGLPTDMVLYATLQVLLAHEVGLDPGAITFMLGDAHIYENHLPLLEEQLKRKPVPPPAYELLDGATPFNFEPCDINLIDYKHHDPINYEFNV